MPTVLELLWDPHCDDVHYEYWVLSLRYWKLSPSKAEAAAWDSAVHQASEEYSHRMVSTHDLHISTHIPIIHLKKCNVNPRPLGYPTRFYYSDYLRTFNLQLWYRVFSSSIHWAKITAILSYMHSGSHFSIAWVQSLMIFMIVIIITLWCALIGDREWKGNGK